MFHLYCFSEKKIEILPHACPSKNFKFVDLNSSEFYNDKERDIYKISEDKITWQLLVLIQSYGDRFNYCYKFNNYDTKKLLSFHIINDKVKICRIKDSESLCKLSDIYNHLFKFEQWTNYILHNQSILYDAIGRDAEIRAKLKNALDEMDKIVELIDANLMAEFNDTFCRLDYLLK